MKALLANLFHDKSISKVFLTSLLVVTFTIIFFLGIFWIYQEMNRHELESQSIRTDYIENQKRHLKQETQTIINFIENERHQARTHLKKEIKQKVYNAHAIATNLYNTYKDELSSTQLKRLITNALRTSFAEEKGRSNYFYINDLKGRVIMNSESPQQEGMNLLQLKDVYGSPIVQNEIETATHLGEGYTNYSWQQENNQKIYSKISFVKFFEPFNWYIGNKKYVDHYKKSIQENILKRIPQLHHGNNLYVTVFSFDGTCLTNTNPKLIGKNLWSQEDVNHTKIVQEFISRGTDLKGGFIQYLDPFSQVDETPSPILIFAKDFKDWQWVIGSGIYMDELECAITNKNKELAKRVNYYIINTILVLLGICILIFLLTKYVIRISNSGLEIFTSFFENAATDSTPIQTTNLHFKEFRSLAKSANHMIKKRQLIEHRLNIETAYFEQLFENSPEAIAITDNFSKGIKVNNQFTKLFGYTNKEIKGVVIDTLLADDTKQKEAAHITSTTSKGQMVDIETQRRCKDGKLLEVSIMGNPIILNDKQIAIFGIYRDITPRKQHEKRLQQAKERAEESDNLKSAFLTNMTHEIRTPMNHILGFTDFLISSNVDEEERYQYAALIKESGRNLMELINNIVDLSKIEAKQITLRKKDCCINHILSRLYEKYYNHKNVSGKEHLILRLQKALNDKDSVINTDPERFQQLISNLIENAIKFTNSGSVEFGYLIEEKGKITFYVKDTGIGISDKHQKEIFKMFRQIDGSNTRKYGGTGLGLTISHRLAELLGGSIGVISKPQEGSYFHFSLPYSKQDNTKESTTQREYEWSGKNILVVDDQINNFKFFKTILKQTQANIIWARDGEEAITECQKRDLDIILMDIQMPRKDGYQATQEIRKFNSEIPIIGQTAYPKRENKEKVLAAGCNDFLAKPIAYDLLLESIHKHISLN